jgi:hypothetical protein
VIRDPREARPTPRSPRRARRWPRFVGEDAGRERLYAEPARRADGLLDRATARAPWALLFVDADPDLGCRVR